MPKILEPDFNPGGHIDIPDTRDYRWDDIGISAAPFDWNKGYDIEFKLAQVLKVPTFSLQQYDNKDQDGSFSCGGQGIGYMGGVKSALATGKYIRKSAKFTYAQVFVPGGGSRLRDLCDVVIKQGWADEIALSSYENNQPPTESFMERATDITNGIRQNAKQSQGLSYVFVTTLNDINSVAQAIAANDGAILLFNGQNNGTWRTVYPQKPSNVDWRHFMYAGKAFMKDGKKVIGAKQSWGAGVGDNGWQYFTEDWFTSGNVLQAVTLVYNNNFIPKFTHTFQVDLTINSSGNEVLALQQALRLDGEFIFPQNTGFYGAATRQAVLAFQNKYGINNSGTNGNNVGPKTRAKLNELFSN